MNKWFKSTITATVALSAMISSHAFSDEQSSPMSEPDWFIQMDAKALSKSHLGKSITEHKSELMQLLHATVGQELMNSVHFINFQGNAGKSDGKAVLLKGDFIKHNALIVEKLQALGFKRKESLNGHIIYSGTQKEFVEHIQRVAKQLNLKLDKEHQHKMNINSDKELNGHVFAALKKDNSIVFSDKLEVVKTWLTKTEVWQPQNKAGVFELIVDVQKSLMHGGINLNEEHGNYEFESISAKQLSHVSMSYTEQNGVGELNIGLKADNYETANKIASVAKGLIALMSLSNQDPIFTELLSTTQLEQNGNNLYLKVSGSVESIRTALIQHGLHE